MHKFISIGDVHADWTTLWAALRAAYAVDANGLPTAPLKNGLFQVVLMGDLVHPKSRSEYARLAGRPEFDFANPEHLFLAARAQVQHLEKLKTFAEASGGHVHILLGNHDDAVLNTNYLLGTGGGVIHTEFDPGRGGVYLPEHLRAWFTTFVRELRVGNLQFAHVGPLPSMAFYDDLFYADSTHKTWWRDTPDLVRASGVRFGVYGHTQMQGGILVHESGDFAMIDALSNRQYLEIMVRPELEQPVTTCRVAPF
ncbi:metallophosphoesterase [Deinococcus yavapaiensis]|uniref:Calcineurin-like phosphoesterase family protein n=1 Tax=Deinococcus yavapaiensis KR-236 TaxID=694435 RepID=A0A318S2M9_9DEIO|nr:metallophosphoesterase [Deinococcus yavapaiensis]PYE51084.1 calcineurin-like phosphoesterase family protein [Deinococcus yavapaiensis KR-236]